MASPQPPLNVPKFERLRDFLGMIPGLTKLCIRIPVYLAILFGIGCGSYLTILFIWRLTEFLYRHCLASQW